MTTPAPRTASAGDRACELYAHHAPLVVITEGHHRHPVYLQNKVYGQIRDTELMWLCSNCHESVHAYLYFLLGERRKPNPLPPLRARVEAKRAWDWYVAEMRRS